MTNSEQKAQLFLQHPDECPDLVGVLLYLIHPPGKLASSAAWRCFRDATLLPLIEHRPTDENLPRFLRQAETILAWRSTVPPTLRFWKAD